MIFPITLLKPHITHMAFHSCTHEFKDSDPKSEMRTYNRLGIIMMDDSVTKTVYLNIWHGRIH